MDKEPLPFAHSITESFADYPAAAEFPGGLSLKEFLDALYTKDAADQLSPHGNELTPPEDSDYLRKLVFNLPPTPENVSVALRIIGESDGLATYALLLKKAQETDASDPRLAGLKSFGDDEFIFRKSLEDELKLKIASRIKKLKRTQGNDVAQDEELGRNLRIIALLNQRADPASLETGRE